MEGEPQTKSILQKPYKEHVTPKHKIKWDEVKLKATEKQQKSQVFMKINEPNTPYIRYDPITDTVEPDLFKLDSSQNNSSPENQPVTNQSEEWDRIDKMEEQIKEEAVRKQHEAFERKRAQHYQNEGAITKGQMIDKDDI